MSGYLKPHPWDQWGSADPPCDPALAEQRELDAWLDDWLAMGNEIGDMEAERDELSNRIREKEKAGRELYAKILAKRPEWRAAMEEGEDPRLGDD